LKKVRPSALGEKRRRKPARRSCEAINSRRLLDEPPDRAEPPACRFHLAAKMRRENHVADRQAHPLKSSPVKVSPRFDKRGYEFRPVVLIPRHLHPFSDSRS
jgi:hypothetical protein